MKKRKIHKKTLILVFIAVAIVGIIISFVKRSDKSMQEVSATINTNEIVRGSNESGAYYLDVNQTGIFYLDNGKMKYLDYATGKSYYICDKANCLHQNKSCGSYAVNFSGFGAYNGYLYAIRKDYQTNSYDLIRMEMNGTDRKVLATIDSRDFGKNKQDDGNLDLEYEDIYYAYGKAYFQIKYSENEYFESEEGESETVYSNPETMIQIMCIDLKSGEKKVLEEISGAATDTELELSLISENKIVMVKKEAPEVLTGLEFEQKLKDPVFVKQLQEMRDSVPELQMQDSWKESLSAFYVEYAQYYLADCTYSILVMDCDTNEISTFTEQKCELWYDSDGVVQGFHTPYSVLDWYEGDIILFSMDEKEGDIKDTKLWRWKLSEKEPEKLMDIGNGSFPMMSFGTVGRYVHDGNKLIYLTYCDDGENAEIQLYHLDTGDSENLYQDTKYVTFRFLGETEDSFIGDMVDGDNHGIYKIQKDDYYAGNLDKAEFLMSAE